MLPERYKWLGSIGTLPKLVAAGLEYLGEKEIPGKASNSTIIEMANKIGLQGIYTNDDISWCAVFINFLCFISGKPLSQTTTDKYELMRAISFSKWGNKVEVKDIQLGDIVVISRTGGYHVFIAIALTKSGNIIGLGGNQSNQTSIAEFDIKRVVAVRRYYATSAPLSAKKYIVDSTGLLSTNEA